MNIREADVIVSALGKSNVVKSEWIRDNTVVVDIGTNYFRDETGQLRVIGDVPFH